MTPPHHTKNTTIRTLTAAILLTTTLAGCIRTVDTTDTTPPNGETPGYARTTPQQPETPTATLPNTPGRAYSNQDATYTPQPRHIDPKDIPDYSWMTHEFDPTSPDFKLFDPCTEIPAEVYQRIGLEPGQGSYYQDSELVLCSFRIVGEHPGAAVTVATDNMTQLDAERQRIVLGDATDSVLPTARYAEGLNRSPNGDSCEMYIVTPRGRLSMLYSTSHEENSFTLNCPVVRGFFEEFVADPEVQATIWS